MESGKVERRPGGLCHTVFAAAGAGDRSIHPSSPAALAATVGVPLVKEAHGAAAAATLRVYMAQPPPTVAFYIKVFSDSQGAAPVGSEVAVTSPAAPGAGTAGTEGNPWVLLWTYGVGTPAQLYFRVEAEVSGARGAPSDLVGPVVLGERGVGSEHASIPSYCSALAVGVANRQAAA